MKKLIGFGIATGLAALLATGVSAETRITYKSAKSGSSYYQIQYPHRGLNPGFVMRVASPLIQPWSPLCGLATTFASSEGTSRTLTAT